MGLNDAPKSSRIHIGFFGKTNAGKSSLVNAITNQHMAIVSDVKGTTTDPVYKSMELLPLGPVEIIDTPGLDDNTTLGLKRVERAKDILKIVDIAIVVVDANMGLSDEDKYIIEDIKKRKIPYIIALNKSDLEHDEVDMENAIYVSAEKNINIKELKEKLATLITFEEHFLLKDIIKKDDIVVLVMPQDESAPKQRLILPQTQTVRELLDIHAISISCQEQELEKVVREFGEKIKLVITDSKVFGIVNNIIPKNIKLTSFSILMARKNGFLDMAMKAIDNINNLKDNDTILICEACTHHRQCNDIGSVVIPNLITKKTNKKLNFEFVSGNEFPKDLSLYDLIIHCGACMITPKEMSSRVEIVRESGVNFINYGILLAYLNGVFERSVEIFK